MGNPLNAEAGMLRPSLAPGLVTAAEDCLNRNTAGIRLFEMGTVFNGSTERVDEKLALGLVAVGETPLSGPHHSPRAFDFYDLKGVVEGLIAKFQTRVFYVDALLLPGWLHPGRGARAAVDGTTVGYFGQLHPAEAQRRKLRQTVYVAEFYLDRLFNLPMKQPRVIELSRYQPVSRDFSFLVPVAVRWEQIASALQSLGIPELAGYQPREIFTSNLAATGRADAEHFSLLLSVLFQAPDRTLKDEEVQHWSRQVVGALEALHCRQRS
jgi:phenylalanyl-tRNA synthetase beta chain